MDVIILQKPKIGEVCNRCGLCCHIQICNTGAFLLRKTKYFGEKVIKGKCPALLSKPDGVFSCGFIEKPSKFIKSKYNDAVISRTVSMLVGAGVGCDELGLSSDDALEEYKLDQMVEDKKNNPNWIENQMKNVELLYKF